MFFAESPITLIPIYFVCMHRFRPAPKPLAVFFNLGYQIPALVVAVPAEPVYKAVSVDYAHRYLCAKFSGSPGFAPLDGRVMGMGDADNALADAAALMIKHPFLLTSDLFDDQQVFIITSIHEVIDLRI
jgi:hypothetical protein